ncbi:hypothetical protein BH23ACT12_BH23ACT12_02880 [soil metagenome]
MEGLSGGWFALIIVGQILVFVLLALLAVKLVKVIKSQNNGMILPPDLSAKLRKRFKRSGKS